ncbi:MAG TPA: penicillin-binding transpeptidase domain-containing protein [Candidatus Paceibacterota bacterium]|nr:penicillin-binding transpeptidase domain-containing protein [Candidatus Paceibacterota bacterium]
MLDSFFRKVRKRVSKSRNTRDIDPDEILIDAKNLPEFNTHQFEGRIERPIAFKTILVFSIVLLFLLPGLLIRAYVLQVQDGNAYATESQNNGLESDTIFAERGAIFDTNGVKLAWNSPDPDQTDFSLRSYAPIDGLGLLLGYVKYPTKDSSGIYYRKDFVGEAGVEKYYDDQLKGQNGSELTETDVKGNIVSQSIVMPPINGQDITLTIDSRIQAELYDQIQGLAERVGFTGGAGAIMDVTNGNIVAMASYPEYDSSVMTEGTDTSLIQQYLKDPDEPFLNRFVGGLYAPGSIVKPYMALAAQKENVIDPNQWILTTGSISIPNPYDPNILSIFKDWQNNGSLDMEKAIAMSSDVYFYIVGGGYAPLNIGGLGISRIDEYMSKMGFGNWTGQGLFAGPVGNVPSPMWKATAFPNDPIWRLGDTYHTAIGQYGFQVTPLQMLRAVASIANGGTLLEPNIIKSGAPAAGAPSQTLPFTADEYTIVRTGMNMGVTQGGPAQGLDVPYVNIAAKTGTAQIGTNNQYLNSWVTGFFPYDNPRYAFAVVMQQGPNTNDLGGVYVMRGLLDWINQNTPEYFKTQ